MAKGKGLCLMYERIREQKITMEDIMAERIDTWLWWDGINAITEQEYSERHGDRGQY